MLLCWTHWTDWTLWTPGGGLCRRRRNQPGQRHAGGCQQPSSPSPFSQTRSTAGRRGAKSQFHHDTTSRGGEPEQMFRFCSGFEGAFRLPRRTRAGFFAEGAKREPHPQPLSGVTLRQWEKEAMRESRHWRGESDSPSPDGAVGGGTFATCFAAPSPERGLGGEVPSLPPPLSGAGR
jgi:hypothetical protein